ncbi:carboxypeptidase-like regulatory domain-containing protein [Bernardetia sp.]|uniref:carboxypeptidase-like regulatory domain-containing protein n=1 Tax=Bernardetia sp. TaxID=1937974 RepID=UPI0025B93E51|nr:carboxypeptidase-like regulatory domain-containing protein [Bernardetia sp.]
MASEKITKYCIKYIFAFLFVFAITTYFSSFSFGQGETQMVRFSGIVVEGDSSYGVAGVHIYIPRAGRGTVTNALGYFTMAAMEGDTVMVSAVGYKSSQIVIPKRGEPIYSVFIDLKQDVQLLNEVVILPYSNAAEFKDMVLAMDTSDPLVEQMKENLSNERLNRMAANMPMGANSNYRYLMQQNLNARNNKFFAPTVPLLNPFAWANFIKSIRNKDYKKPLRTTTGGSSGGN